MQALADLSHLDAAWAAENLVRGCLFIATNGPEFCSFCFFGSAANATHSHQYVSAKPAPVRKMLPVPR